ncbi:MAG: CopY family transcriptional regulator [SAR86 cluster bacterium]|uniref:CopY family transcriptional regulator n=1 Tax=SAR86 cluster bacterium TaxID=2030880 RepID=A0A2A5AW25_9GAMM|nr:MAG: CopY family transcriptional regulator [SAR86 cluster bacterium]
MTKASKLSRRERQMMDIIYRLEEASAKEVQDNLEDPPSYSSVRTLLRKLVEKGHISHRESGLKYVYYPLVARKAASRTALSNIVKTFFSDSPLLAVNSLLDMSNTDISDEELKQLEKLIKDKKKANKLSGKNLTNKKRKG